MDSGEMRGPKQANEISSGDLGYEQESSQHGCGQAGQVPQEPVMMTENKEEPRDREKLNPSDITDTSGPSQA